MMRLITAFGLVDDTTLADQVRSAIVLYVAQPPEANRRFKLMKAEASVKYADYCVPGTVLITNEQHEQLRQWAEIDESNIALEALAAIGDYKVQRFLDPTLDEQIDRAKGQMRNQNHDS
jgi:hypothetical protein